MEKEKKMELFKKNSKEVWLKSKVFSSDNKNKYLVCQFEGVPNNNKKKSFDLILSISLSCLFKFMVLLQERVKEQDLFYKNKSGKFYTSHRCTLEIIMIDKNVSIFEKPIEYTLKKRITLKIKAIEKDQYTFVKRNFFYLYKVFKVEYKNTVNKYFYIKKITISCKYD